MLPPSSKNSSQILPLLCEEKSSFTSKFARISLKTNPQSPSYYKVLLFVEYLQLISSILFLNLSFTNPKKQPLFSNVLIYAAKFTNPASWVISDQIKPFAIIILSITVVLVSFKAFLFFHISFKIIKRKSIARFLLRIWRHRFNLQGRVIYGVLTSFWTVTLYIMKTHPEEREKYSFPGIMIMNIVIMSAELALSLYLNIKICYILPRKNFLSAKDNITEIITLLQKVLLQIFIMASNSSLTYLWIFAAVNLVIDLIRNGYFFRTLPLYQFKALFYQRTLLMMVLSLNLAIFMMCIVKSVSEESNDPALLVLVWLINFVCLFKISGFFLQTSFWNLISNNSLQQSPYLMVHKITAIKELRRLNQTQFGDYSTKLSWKFLANRSANHSILKNMTSVSDHSPHLDINSKETSHIIFRSYLENLLKENPDDEFIRLAFAQFQVKKLKLFGDAILITRSLLQSSSSIIKLNAELLLLDIQNLFKLKYSQEDSQNQLNLREFIFQNSLLAKAKEMMVIQAELQIQICKETSKEFPNLVQIHSKAQKLNTQRNKTITFIENMHRTISDYNLESLLLFAQYYQTLNHSPKENSQYIKEYSLKLRKYQTALDDIRILQENIFHPKVCFAIVSGNEHDAGSIVYASNTMLNFLGKNADSVLGINFTINMPPCLRAFYTSFYKNQAEKSHPEVYGRIAQGFLYHKNNYLIPTEYYSNIFPFVTQGFYFALISKPLPYLKDFIYILEDGEIDSTTQHIGETLNLLIDSSSFHKKLHPHISEISDYLPIVNDAFNMIAFPEKYPPTEQLSLETSNEVYSLFTSGADLLLKPTKSQIQDPISYRCTLTNIPFGPVFIKLLSLEKNKIHKEDCPTYQTYQTDSPIRPSSPKETPHNLNSLSSKSSQTEAIFHTSEEEEKEGGWIDIEAMQTESLRGYIPSIHSTRLLSSPDRPKETELEYFAITKPDEEVIMSPNSRQRLITIPRFSQSTGAQNVDFQIAKQQRSTRYSLTTSHLSKISNKKRLYKFYQSSLKVDFCPKYVRALYIISYIAFFVFILSQILLKIAFDNHAQAIKTKKDILRNSEVRSFQLVTIQSGMRILWDIAQGTLKISSLGALQPFIRVYPYLLIQRITTLGALNDNLLRNTSELDPNLRDSIFVKNVKIYDNYFGEIPDPYILLDTFKATDSITGAGLRFLKENLWNSTTPLAETTANFLFRNSLNDLPLQNQGISNLVLQSLNDQYASFHKKANLFGSLVCAGFLLVIIAFIMGMWKQYVKETFNLSAFCRLGQAHLEKVILSYESFKIAIENQSLQRTNERNIHLPPKQKEKSYKSRHIVEHLKQPNYKSLRKKFFILAVRTFLLFLALILFTIASAVIVHIFEECFETKQDQVFVADHSLNRMSLLLSSTQEMISTKNTAKIENRLALKELEMLIQKLVFSKTRAYNVLFISKNDEEMAKKLRALILEDSCSITRAEIFNFCEVLESNGKKTGLIYLLNDIESYSRDELEGYQRSYQNETALQELKGKNLGMKLITFIVAELACQEFSTSINNSFEKEKERARRFSTGVLILAFGMTFGVFMLVWKLVLGRLRAGVNEFKNVLKVLPADLVLSSFILKQFLINTSKGVLKGLLRIDF